MGITSTLRAPTNIASQSEVCTRKWQRFPPIRNLITNGFHPAVRSNAMFVLFWYFSSFFFFFFLFMFFYKVWFSVAYQFPYYLTGMRTTYKRSFIFTLVISTIVHFTQQANSGIKLFFSKLKCDVVPLVAFCLKFRF